MSGPQDTIIRELLELAARPEVISFAGGLPSPEGFPVEDVREAAEHVIRTAGRQALQYSSTEGEPELRRAIAALETSRGVETSPDEVQIVSGSQQALDLIARLFIDEGSRILVENPTYMGALLAFKNCGPTFGLLPTDAAGLNPAALDDSFKGARFAYVMPTYANPTGMTMTEERRIVLAQKAKELDLWLVEDDPYGELWYEKRAPKSLRAWAPERTLRLGTLSKVLSPGLRLGYICGPREVLDKISLLKQSIDLHTSTLTQKIAARVIESGKLEAHLPQVRELYRTQGTAMLQALKEFMPEGVTWTEVEGGMFIWVTLPESIDTTELMREAVANNVAFVPGAPFYALGGNRNHLRLSFVTVPVPRIREGIERLGKLIASKL
ncbi:MAG: PLP-dependent aminotransferase family protein [Sutterellaceae bacterium]|nr:PLP-dependent aminotransferase family protein [Sutterellaceae bacterium]